MTMLKLSYYLKRDEHQTVTVLGDAHGISNLYWQLTHNYAARDGQEIGGIQVTDLDGRVVHNPLLNAWAHGTRLSKLEL